MYQSLSIGRSIVQVWIPVRLCLIFGVQPLDCPAQSEGPQTRRWAPAPAPAPRPGSGLFLPVETGWPETGGLRWIQRWTGRSSPAVLPTAE